MIQGVKEGKVTVFKGIPYAAPPVGDLRWQAPQPVQPWEGIKVCDQFGPIAMQADQDPNSFYCKEFYWQGLPERSEDCLYLNVWTPSKAVGKASQKLPVALWIHGGGFSAGFSNEITMDGTEWAKRGVILVSINYRLGMLGFLGGNYGIQDQMAALKWAHDNIAAFGGDPENITLMGQSAGALSIKQLVTSPLSKDYIAKAIIQSGGGLALVSSSRTASTSRQATPLWEPPKEVTSEIDGTLGCPGVTDAPNQWIAFRKDVRLAAVPESVPARIAVDSKYWLWVNGELVVFEGGLKRGPNPQDSYFDEVDLAPYLRKGENQVALLLWYFGKGGFSHLSSGQPQLWFDAPALGDAPWMCRVHPAYGTATDLPAPNLRLPESSIAFDARKDLGNWQTGALEGFVPAVTLENTLGVLHSRPIPQWKDFGIRTVAFETRSGADADTLVALLPYNMQMTPVLSVEDAEGGHRIVIETDHAKVVEECLRAEYVTKAGTQEYESLGWLSGRRIILTVDHGARVTALKYRETGYDTAPDGTFNSSDPFFNRFWEKGLRTIYVNSRDSFFDCPDRERGQWWGDIVTILGESFYTYSPSIYSLIRKGIRELCDWQRPDDILFSPIPSNYGVELPCQMLAAVGRYGIWNYYMNTGDLETVRHAYPIVKKYLATYHIGKDGLLEWHDGDWNWGDWGDNRDMRLLQNLWYVLALQSVSNMADAIGLLSEGSGYRGQMLALCESINRVAWTGTCYRHPEYTGETDDRVNALAVLAGLVDRDQYDALFEVFKTQEHASPYMEKYVMEALFAIGHGDYALERERRRYAFMVNHPDHDTLFENWNVGVDGDWDCGSVNHAWSGGPLAVIPARMLGIAPLDPGWKRFSVRPDSAVFDECSISFPTVAGTISVTYSRSGDFMEVTVPEGTIAEVSLPDTYLRKALGPGKHRLPLTFKQETSDGHELAEAAGYASVDAMRSVPYAELDAKLQPVIMGLFLKALTEGKDATAALVTVPHWDGKVVDKDFDTAVYDGTVADIPYLIGSVTADGEALGGEGIRRFSQYRNAYSAHKAYSYQFTRNLPGDDEDPAKDSGAFHSGELWYMFGTLDRSWRPFTKADYKLSKQMLDAWTRFCKTGNPGWAPDTVAAPNMKVFDIQ
jgi:hypothetical protein